MCIQEYMHMHMQVPLSSGSVAPLIIHSLAYLRYLFRNTFMLVITFTMLVGGCTNFSSLIYTLLVFYSLQQLIHNDKQRR